MRRVLQGPGVPGWTRKRLSEALVGPWQYQCAGERGTGRVGRGSTHPVYPPCTTPGALQPPAVASAHPSPRTSWLALTCSLRRPKEILGVEYAQVYWGAVRYPRAPGTARHAPHPPLQQAAPTRLVLSISQYFSVFLRLALASDPSILRS